MHEPDTRYARLDGSRIAYQISGDGPLDLVVCMGMASIDAEWDEPEIAHFYRRLGEIGRVVRFDDLGSGGSDPVPPDVTSFEESSLQQVEAVMEAAGTQRAVLLAGDSGTPGAILAAAKWHGRVVGLVVYQGAARVVAGEDYPDGLPTEVLDQWAAYYDVMDVDQILRLTAPSRTDDPEFMRWARKWLRGVASPATVEAMIHQAKETDVRWALPKIEAPTVAIHRTGFDSLPMALTKYVAEHAPNGRFVEIPGTDGPPWFDHPDEFLDVIRDLVREVSGEALSAVRTERNMATVLFTDLVSSTEKAQQAGDAEWRNLLQLHEDVSGRCVRDAGGRLVKTTGDGILAVFDGPTKAIQCALTLSRNLARLQLPIRAGIHTGEIEVRGDDVGGIAVHIAARVMATAGPGEVLVSRTVKDLVTGSEFVFTDRGSHQLRGVDGEWQLYALGVVD